MSDRTLAIVLYFIAAYVLITSVVRLSAWLCWHRPFLAMFIVAFIRGLLGGRRR